MSFETRGYAGIFVVQSMLLFTKQKVTTMKPVFSFLFTVVLLTTLKAQGWERLYGPGNAADFLQTPDGGFLLAGVYNDWAAPDKAWLLKTNSAGNVEWTQRYHVGDTLEAYSAVQLLGGQHIVAAGEYMLGWQQNQPEHFAVFIHKLDAGGNLLTDIRINPTPNQNTNYQTADLVISPSGEILIAVNAGSNQTLLYRFDTDLQQLGQTSYPAKINQIVALPDGALLLCGAKNNTMYLAKTNAAGAPIWEKTYETGEARMTLTGDGNIVLAKNGKILKVNAAGDLLWSKPGPGGGSPNWVTEDTEGNLLVTGYYNANFTFVFKLAKHDANGNKIWEKTPHQSLFGASSHGKPMVTADGDYAVAGQRNGKSMLIRSDTGFDLYRSWIAGSMYHDLDDDCVKDPGEKALKSFFAAATDANGTVWSESVRDGQYAFQVPPGTYEVAISKRSFDPENWLPCDAQSATISAATDTAHIPAIGVKSLVDCPRPRIRAAIPKVRSCHEGRYNLSYYNLGTQKATGTQIEVELAPNLNYVGSDMTLLSQDGQKLLFDIGELDIDGEGTASIDVFCACDAAIGDLSCSTFRILPDTCYPVLPDWDHSIVKIDASFDPTQLYFTLQNVGTGDMAQSRWYRLRNTCLNVVGAGNFQLDAGESLNLTFPNQAAVYYFEAEPAPSQPYIPGTAWLLSRCQPGPPETAWMNNSTGSPFYDVDCMEVSNSFDPNDIRVTPRGDGPEGAILADESELHYMIRFQNTGNDTAYTVSIRDVLPEQLDILSVAPGPSSHPYSFDLQNNEIQFLFAGINLPDSVASPEGSQGYVEFSVRMKPNLTPGTRIENRAAIYFDFNAPVITNTALNTIASPILVSVDEAPKGVALLPLRVSPNPAVVSAVFRFDEPAEGQLLLFDAGGRQLRQVQLAGETLELNCRDLEPGIYFFRILTEEGKTAQGKLVKQ